MWRHAPAAVGTTLLVAAAVVGTQVALAQSGNPRAPLSPYGEGGFTVAAAAVDKRVTITSADDGSYVLGYTPAGGDVVLDLDMLSGDTVQPWWYDPRSGRTLKMRTLDSEGVARFPVPKEGGGPSWVLVVDDVAAGYGAPDPAVVAQATGKDESGDATGTSGGVTGKAASSLGSTGGSGDTGSGGTGSGGTGSGGSGSGGTGSSGSGSSGSDSTGGSGDFGSDTSTGSGGAGGGTSGADGSSADGSSGEKDDSGNEDTSEKGQGDSEKGQDGSEKGQDGSDEDGGSGENTGGGSAKDGSAGSGSDTGGGNQANGTQADGKQADGKQADGKQADGKDAGGDRGNEPGADPASGSTPEDGRFGDGGAQKDSGGQNDSGGQKDGAPKDQGDPPKGGAEPVAPEPTKEPPKAAAPAKDTKPAADGSWDKLAKCESSGDWAINTGNGYYGGLQFDSATWSDFGGTKYAPRADKASKEQQIEIASKVRDARGGYSSWPACSSKLGLPK